MLIDSCIKAYEEKLDSGACLLADLMAQSPVATLHSVDELKSVFLSHLWSMRGHGCATASLSAPRPCGCRSS